MNAAPSFFPSSALAWWRRALHWRETELVDPIDRAAVLSHVVEAGALGPRFAFMTLMACGIATLGLLQNSVAVIIGAMLISPLMGPIIELGMGLATFDFRVVRQSLRTLAVGIAVALGTSILIVTASPLQDATPELLARTQPTLFDLLVAIFSGLAGAYATVTRKGETIVGVAIATALMPPLAVCGYGIAVANADVAGGAAFLFMTNLLAIALSATIVARLYGFGGNDSPKQTAWQAGLIIGIFVVLSLPLGLALRDIAARGVIERTVRQTLDAETSQLNGRVSALRVNAATQPVQVDAVVMLPRHAATLPQRLEHLLETRLKQPIDLQIRELLLQDDARIQRESATLAELRTSVAQLRDAAVRQTETRAVQNAARDALFARLGTLETLADGRQRLLLAPASGLSLDAARALQPPADDAGTGITVVPPLQSLPSIVFADDSAALDAAMRARIDTVAWAVRQWRIDTLTVTGFGGTPALASARAQAVAQALRTQGLQADVTVASREQLRARVQAQGNTAARSVQIALAPTAAR